MNRINDATRDFMMTCATYQLDPIEILAVTSLITAQQLAYKPPIWTARWMNMMKDKKKEIQQLEKKNAK